MASNGWIAVDLDGTLAHYDGWKGEEHIGPPIETMMARVKAWLEKGYRVKVFTARASVPSQVQYVRVWLDSHGLNSVEVTNVKDFEMIELWDDRAVQVIPNTGTPVGQSTRGLI